MTKILTFKYDSHFAKQFYESIDEKANTAYYIFTGDHYDKICECQSDIDTPKNDYREVLIDAYNNMIFGKRISKDDAALVIRNIPYVAGKTFAMYNDNDDDLFNKDFYCIVNEGSFFHVYKCLNNNFDSPSTVEPQLSFVNEDSNYIFQTSDSYVWKYMGHATNLQEVKFATQNYFPIYENDQISSLTLAGSIDVIKIERSAPNIFGGRRYDNYTSGTFTTSNLRINGNNTLYSINNASISYDPGFYTGCLIYISDGIGSGQYRTINDYFSNANGNYIVLNLPFSINPENGSTYEISPEVIITGSGTETVTARARAIVDPLTSNSIQNIEMLERGVGYTFATANVVANSTITSDPNFIEANVYPIYSPSNGHGYDPATELGCDAICFSTEFANSENGTLVANNKVQKIGLMTDPIFANVNIEMANTVGVFSNGEVIYKIDPIQINTNVFVSIGNSTLTSEIYSLSNAVVVSSGTLGSYAPNDILTIDGGSAVVNSTLSVNTTTVRAASINTAGYGYASNGSFVATITTGNAIVNAAFLITTSNTGVPDSINIDTAGVYSTNPSPLDAITIAGGNCVIQLSANNGDDWTDQVVANDEPMYAIASNGSNLFLAGGKDGALQSSTDGTTWLNRTGTSTKSIRGIAFGDSVFCCVGDDGEIQTTATGSIWTKSTSANSNHMYGIGFGNSIFVAVGADGAVQNSPDGITWTNRVTANTNTMRACVYGNGVFVAVGDNGAVMSSTGTGDTWTNRTTANTNNMYALTYDTGTFVAVGDNGAVMSSGDGVSWINETTANTNHMRCATFGNSTFMAMGENGAIMTSADGSTWLDEGGTSNTNNVDGVAFGTGIGFIATGGEGSDLTVFVEMGLNDTTIVEPGAYSVAPTDLSTNEPLSSGNGSGAEISLVYTSTTTADFVNQLTVGDWVYIEASDGSAQQLATVTSAPNATHMTIETGGKFACSETIMYLPQVTSSGKITQVTNTTNILISNVVGVIDTGETLVGATSGAKTTTNTIYRNDVAKNFDSFIQLYKYNITISANNFINNEIVYQGNTLASAVATALVHSVETTGNTTVLYTSNQVGQFTTGEIFGANSSATATVDAIYSPELVPGSGQVIFLENVEEINRDATKSERFKIIITA